MGDGMEIDHMMVDEEMVIYDYLVRMEENEVHREEPDVVVNKVKMDK